MELFEVFNSYTFIIEASVIIVISYFFNIISDKTNIPSVLMLLGLGFLIQFELYFLEIKNVNFMPILEILGIIGLIMIVLEAAMDLELSRKKWPIIWRSFWVAFLGTFINTALLAGIFYYFKDIPVFSSILYAVPLAIMSSAIVIPSVKKLNNDKREFLIYESTFSDIIGIMFFYFILESIDIESPSMLTLSITGNIFLTIVIAVVSSYLLILIFQNIKTQVKLFLLISVLFILFSIGKLLHLSSLLIILVFGLFLENTHLVFRGFMRRFLHRDVFSDIYRNFKLITLETSFIIRTFFFVIFGVTISVPAIFNLEVVLISLAFLVIIFGSRYLLLWIFTRTHLRPELFIAPRGLISILLFYAIPQGYQSSNIEQGILFFIIIVSGIVMSISLVRYEKRTKQKIKNAIDNVIEDNF